MASCMQIQGEWKNIEIDPNSYLQHDLSGFVCMQELTDYNIVTENVKESSNKTKKKRKTKSSTESKTSAHENEKQGRERPDADSDQDIDEGNKRKGKLSAKKRKTDKIPDRDSEDAKSTAKQKLSIKKKKKGRESLGKIKETSNCRELSTNADGNVQADATKKTPAGICDKMYNNKTKSNKSSDDSTEDVQKARNLSPKQSKRLKNRGTKRKMDSLSQHETKSIATPPKKKAKSSSQRFGGLHDSNIPDMSAWKDLFVPDAVLIALAELGFSAPTPIQTLVLAPAIRDRKDIVGAAETGSGKTLAFGIPLIHTILRLKLGIDHPSNKEKDDGESEMIDSDPDDLDSGEMSLCDRATFEDNQEMEDDDSEHGFSDDSELDEDATDLVHTGESSFAKNQPQNKKAKTKPLYALVLTPTRELAIQVRDHMEAAAKYTGVKIVAVVGGMSVEKQKRLLRKQPEIVVATPGRLWDLLEEGDSHLSKISDIKSLVIDEADRMVEKGHFEELSKLLQLINREENMMIKRQRQTFVFSATLTFVHSGPQRLKYKKKSSQLTEKQKLEDLMTQVGIKPKPKIVDLTRSQRTAETLTEARLSCTLDEKDLFLYYFLMQYPGRTLVFANSKDCIRRLASILNLLKCCPLPLHADMHQRQRLKNLDRFKGNPRGLLLATDVAARGLDIPDVKHVIHYQVPRTTESYVHRSGRTARASKEGLSVVFVGPEDLQYYRKIIKSLNRDEDLPIFPVEQNILPNVKARVNTARHIDKLQHRFNKQKMQNSWFEKAAKDMDIILDEEDLLNDLGSNREQSQLRKSLDQFNSDLTLMLRAPLSSQIYMGKYPTKSGKLPSRSYDGKDNAVLQLKQAQKHEASVLGRQKNKRKSKAHVKHKKKNS